MRSIFIIFLLGMYPFTVHAGEDASQTLPTCKGEVQKLQLGKYVEWVKSSHDNILQARTFDLLHRKGICKSNQPCVFRDDFAYWIWSPGWKIAYVIDVGNGGRPIMQGVKTYTQLWPRVDMALTELLQSLNCRTAKIHYYFHHVFKTLAKEVPPIESEEGLYLDVEEHWFEVHVPKKDVADK